MIAQVEPVGNGEMSTRNGNNVLDRGVLLF